MPIISQNLIDMYTTRTMVPYIVTNPGVPTFLRDRLFANVRTFDSKKIDIDVKKGGRDVPVYSAVLEYGNLVEHEGYATFTYEPPHYHEYKVVKPSDLQFREIGENVYDYTPPAQQLSEKMSENFADLDSRLNTLEELQAVNLLTTGKLIPKDKDGNAFPEIDFRMQTSHRPVLTGSSAWSDDSVKKNAIIEQMEGWNFDLLVKDGNKSVGIIIMGREARRWFMRKMDPDNETSGFNSIRVTRGEVNPGTLAEGVSYVGRFAELGDAPIYCYAGWYRDPWDHTTKNLFPENMVLMVSAGARFDRNYGFIENFGALRGLPRFPRTKLDPDGRFVENHLESTPLLSPYEIDCVVAAQVVL
jgi:hypothetical protein